MKDASSLHYFPLSLPFLLLFPVLVLSLSGSYINVPILRIWGKR